MGNRNWNRSCAGNRRSRFLPRIPRCCQETMARMGPARPFKEGIMHWPICRKREMSGQRVSIAATFHAARSGKCVVRAEDASASWNDGNALLSCVLGTAESLVAGRTTHGVPVRARYRHGRRFGGSSNGSSAPGCPTMVPGPGQIPPWVEFRYQVSWVPSLRK